MMSIMLRCACLFTPGKLTGLFIVTEYGLLAMVYGLYFDVLGRDIISLACESMAQSIGVSVIETFEI